MQNGTQQAELLQEIHSIIYPTYPPGCTPQVFLQAHLSLFQTLTKFDLNCDLNILASISTTNSQSKQLTSEEQQFNEKMVMEIINLLNQSCTYCHRKEFSDRLFVLLNQFKGNLKNLAIGKRPIKISSWQSQLDLENISNLLYSLKEEQLREISDQQYMQYHRIPNQQILLLNYREIIVAKDRFQKVLHNVDGNIPADHHYFLAIIAAATYGCKYLWSKSVKDFLKVGGDIQWVKEGIKAAPLCLQEMSKYSSLMAYSFRSMFQQNIFKHSQKRSSCIDNEYKLQALILLSYYHSLACLDLICGLEPQSNQYMKYLPNQPNILPSMASFETVQKTQGIDNVQQLKTAEQFTSLYSWENNQQQFMNKMEGVRSFQFKKAKSLEVKRKISSSIQLQQNQIYFFGKVEEDQIYQKVNGLQHVKYLKKVFQKYVDFEPLSKHYQNRKCITNINGEKDQNDLILASDWDFQLKGLTCIQSTLGAKHRQTLVNLIDSLKLLEPEKGKKLKIYYQFFNNYMYEYVSYTKLMKQLTMNQRNYLKLVTKSPFLFTQLTFAKMKKDLAVQQIDVLDFVFQAMSYKLQLSVSMLTFIFDSFKEDDYEYQDS